MNLMEYYKKIYQFVLSRKNKFECKNSHFQSVIEPLSLDHPVLINSIYSKFSGKKGNEDCQGKSPAICSHKFTTIARVYHLNPQSH